MKYKNTTSRAKVLSHDRFGTKVLQLKDHSILKLFRTKRLISSARIYPYSQRFKHNASRLSRLGVPTVSVLDSFKIPHIRRTAVRYKPLRGRTLRDYLRDHSITGDVSKRLSRFMAQLHRTGVYFRSIHFGNIVVMDDGGFGLIDISDMKIKSRGLSFRRRLRNFRHFTRYDVDRKLIQPMLNQFLDEYSSLSDLSQKQRELLHDRFRVFFAQNTPRSIKS